MILRFHILHLPVKGCLQRILPPKDAIKWQEAAARLSKMRFENQGLKTGSFAVTHGRTPLVATMLLIFPCVRLDCVFSASKTHVLTMFSFGVGWRWALAPFLFVCCLLLLLEAKRKSGWGICGSSAVSPLVIVCPMFCFRLPRLFCHGTTAFSLRVVNLFDLLHQFKDRALERYRPCHREKLLYFV